jgi:hypothetical protein
MIRGKGTLRWDAELVLARDLILESFDNDLFGFQEMISNSGTDIP